MKINKQVKAKFVALLGKEIIESIENDNWVDYSENESEGTIEIRFKEKDGIGDTVIFLSINYNKIEKKWWTENVIDYPDVLFDSYDEMIEHYQSLEDRILDNGDQYVEF